MTNDTRPPCRRPRSCGFRSRRHRSARSGTAIYRRAGTPQPRKTPAARNPPTDPSGIDGEGSSPKVSTRSQTIRSSRPETQAARAHNDKHATIRPIIRSPNKKSGQAERKGGRAGTTDTEAIAAGPSPRLRRRNRRNGTPCAPVPSEKGSRDSRLGAERPAPSKIRTPISTRLARLLPHGARSTTRSSEVRIGL